MSAERAEVKDPETLARWRVLGENGPFPEGTIIVKLLDALADAQREATQLADDLQVISARWRAAEQRAAALEDVIRDLFHATAQHHCKVCREAMKRHAELIRSCEITRSAPRPEGPHVCTYPNVDTVNLCAICGVHRGWRDA